eukprot:scaffold19699_cov29-Tisochrysis_lutea.AAC.2
MPRRRKGRRRREQTGGMAQYVGVGDAQSPEDGGEEHGEVVEGARGVRPERIVVHNDQVDVHQEAPAVGAHIGRQHGDKQWEVGGANEMLDDLEIVL